MSENQEATGIELWENPDKDEMNQERDGYWLLELIDGNCGLFTEPEIKGRPYQRWMREGQPEPLYRRSELVGRIRRQQQLIADAESVSKSLRDQIAALELRNRQLLAALEYAELPWYKKLGKAKPTL